jgi:hypothetical protein
MYMAPTKEQALVASNAFLALYGRKFERPATVSGKTKSALCLL